MYGEYKSLNVSSSSPTIFEHSRTIDSDGEITNQMRIGFTGGFKRYIRERSGTSLVQKMELEQYLEEALFPLDDSNDLSFDILNWWKLNGPKYPILAKMACDILAIPVSTAASESAFSWGRRIVDDSRSSLASETVETLICIKDWLPSIGDKLSKSINYLLHIKKF